MSIIVDASSLAYTFPLTTLQPAILFFNQENLLEERTLGEITFEDRRFHLVAYNINTLEKHLDYLIQLRDENRNPYKKILEEYREKEVYHFGHSSEVIAEFIVKNMLQ